MVSQSLWKLGRNSTDKQGGGADEKAETEDDEAESIDDSSSNHPFTHHLLIPVSLLTQSSVHTYSCLQQIVNWSQQTLHWTDALAPAHCCCCCWWWWWCREVNCLHAITAVAAFVLLIKRQWRRSFHAEKSRQVAADIAAYLHTAQVGQLNQGHLDY